ncbi:hypothetical protein, partial [Bacteroides acidifaciens]|uniref:hypothetical protein n=1 Tax=Bacteroides acidifaciens TaxID=85831 RepID=UPI0025A5ED1B
MDQSGSMGTSVPLHYSTGGSPQYQLSPNMQNLNNSFQNFVVNNEIDEWEIDRDFNEPQPINTSTSPNEEEFYAGINQIVEKQLEEHPANPNRHGNPRPPNPQDVFGKSYHDRDDFGNFLKTLDKNRQYPCDELVNIYNVFFHTKISKQSFCQLKSVRQFFKAKRRCFFGIR